MPREFLDVLIFGIFLQQYPHEQLINCYGHPAQRWRVEEFGIALIEHAIGFAREKELIVIPLWPYAKSIINRDESLQDVLN